MLKNLVELVKEEDFEDFLQKNQDKLVLVKFSAVWCLPCRELQKNLGELEKEKPDLVILEVDVEKFPQLAQKPQFRVKSLPSFFLFHQGKMIKEGYGNRSVQQLREFINV